MSEKRKPNDLFDAPNMLNETLNLTKKKVFIAVVLAFRSELLATAWRFGL